MVSALSAVLAIPGAAQNNTLVVCSCFHDYPAMLTRIYNHLRPGGYAEFLEYAFEFVGADAAAEAVYQASSFARFIRCVVAGGATHGKDFHSGRKLKNWMIEVGYVDVVEQQFLVPLNQWPLDPTDKTLGGWSSLNWLKFLGGTTKLLAAGGVPLEEIPALLEEVRRDITSWNMRVYWISKSLAVSWSNVSYGRSLLLTEISVRCLWTQTRMTTRTGHWSPCYLNLTHTAQFATRSSRPVITFARKGQMGLQGVHWLQAHSAAMGEENLRVTASAPTGIFGGNLVGEGEIPPVSNERQALTGHIIFLWS